MFDTFGRTAGSLVLLLLGLVTTGQGQEPPQDPDSIPRYELAPLTVEGRAADLSGEAATASQGHTGRRDLAQRPFYGRASCWRPFPASFSPSIAAMGRPIRSSCGASIWITVRTSGPA